MNIKPGFNFIHYIYKWISRAIQQFIEAVNSHKNKVVTPATAIKFLLARKFDVPRAVILYEQHEQTRQREGLYNFDPLSDPLKSELETGKFTILPGRDGTGAAIALFTANRHYPMTVAHKTTLQGVVYQLDVALQNIETQKAGLVFIYDMSGSKYSNFDYDLSQKILTLLKGGYPARLKKVLIVTAPLWFKAPFKILRLFVREKLRERVFTVSVPQLTLHIPRDSLPKHLGGLVEIDHFTWLVGCFAKYQQLSMTNREEGSEGGGGGGGGGGGNEDDLLVAINNNLDNILSDVESAMGPILTNNSSSTTTTSSTSPKFHNSREEKRITINNNNSLECVVAAVGDDSNPTNGGVVEKLNLNNNNNANSNNNEWTENPPSSASSGFSDDDSLAGLAEGDPKTIEQIVQMVRERGRHGLIEEYSEIRARAPDGSFTNAKLRTNLNKNRYSDVLCYDHSRVVLSKLDGENNDMSGEESPSAVDPSTDYINANFVDGYKQRNAYISTQGPLPKTSADFWRMVWEQHCCVIVMTTRVNERGKIKCGQYWDTLEGNQAQFGQFQIKTKTVSANEDYTVASLELTNLKTDETRNVSHWQFTSWPDYGVPSSAMAMLNFLQRVREQQAIMVKALGDTWAGHPKGPPLVVHCSAGIGRTGTFITLDICISRLEDVGTADIRGTVEKIRSQRAFSIQMPDQYVFCHLALIEYALSRGMLQSADLAGFDDREEDSD